MYLFDKCMFPYHCAGMEFYSSALWHLQQEVPLSLLASQLYDSSKLRPQALCAMASVMNLNKDHDASAKYLQRAIQVAHTHTHTHTHTTAESYMYAGHWSCDAEMYDCANEEASLSIVSYQHLSFAH